MLGEFPPFRHDYALTKGKLHNWGLVASEMGAFRQKHSTAKYHSFAFPHARKYMYADTQTQIFSNSAQIPKFNLVLNVIIIVTVINLLWERTNIKN